jgi:hypothetical protein
MKMFLLFLTLLSASLFSQTPIVNTLQLTNGKILQGKVEIERKSFGKDQIVFNDTITYALEDVDRFETSKDTFIVRRKAGSGYVHQIFKLEQEGNLDLYSQQRTAWRGGGGSWSGVGPGAIYMPGPSFPVEVKDYYFNVPANTESISQGQKRINLPDQMQFNQV